MIKTAHKTQRKPSAAAHGTQHTAPIPAQRHGDNGKGKTQFVPQENKCPEAFASGHFGPGHEPYLIGMLVPNRENPMSGIHHLFPAHPPQKTLDRILHQAADRHRPHTARHGGDDRSLRLDCGEIDVAAQLPGLRIAVYTHVDHHGAIAPGVSPPAGCACGCASSSP